LDIHIDWLLAWVHGYIIRLGSRFSRADRSVELIDLFIEDNGVCSLSVSEQLVSAVF
jgi:hypothetical protein